MDKKVCDGQRTAAAGGKRIRIVRVLLIVTVCFIWFHSLAPADLSGEESMRWSDRLNRLFSCLHLPLRFAGDHLLRKIAHFSEYALLGAESTLYFLWSGKLRQSCGCHHLWYAGLTVAFIDETIQLFVPGRSGELRDVWLDLAGYTLLMAAVLIFAGKQKAGDGTE